MTSKKTQTVLAVMVIGGGLLLIGIAGMFVYTVSTAKVLHSTAEGVPSVSALTPAPMWTDAVTDARQIVRDSLVEQNLPGLSVAVGVGGDLVWAEGFGWADLDTLAPVLPDTRFRLGTASTVLTSAAAGLLIEQNQLRLDESIRTWVPEFPEKPWPVTLRAVMGHTAGMRNDGGDEGPLYGEPCGRPADGVRLVGDYPLRVEPGTEYRFSSYGWILVSAAIEAASGESMLAYMRRNVFEPLGMHDTKADALDDPAPNLATSYFPRMSAEPRYGLHGLRPVNYSCYAGASVFVSTSSDLVRFGLGVTNGTLLQPATRDLLQTTQRLSSGQETGYGLGWDLETVELAGVPTRWTGHEGTVLGGMVASLLVFPDRGLVVAVLSNISYADTETLGVRIAEAFSR